MVDVILTRPVTHDGENLVPGDTIAALSEKEADRLVRLRVARRADPRPVQPPPPPAGADGADDDPAAGIARMKKSELIAALADLGVEANDRETNDALRAKLAAARAEPPAGGRESGEGGDPSPEEEEILAMTRGEIIAALADAGVKAADGDGDDLLREKLRKAWAEPNGSGGA